MNAETTLDCRLTSGAGTDAEISYTVSSGADVPLDRLFGRLLPTRYEVTPDESTETALEPADSHRLVGGYLQGMGERSHDWQTALTPYADFTGNRDRRETTQNTVTDLRVPLSDVCEALASSPYPAIVQLLVTPKPDWRRSAEDRIIRLVEMRDTLGQRAFEATIGSLFGDPYEEPTRPDRRTPAYRRTENDMPQRTQPRRVHPEIQARIDAIEARDTRVSFDVECRVVVFLPDEEATADPDDDADADADLRTDSDDEASPRADTHSPDTTEPEDVDIDPAEATDAGLALCDEVVKSFSPVETKYTWFECKHVGDGTDTPGSKAAGTKLLQAIHERTPHPFRRWYHRLIPRLGARPYRSFVVDRRELGSFLLLDGDAVASSVRRALNVIDSDRTAVTLPPKRVLERYWTDGFPLGTCDPQQTSTYTEPIAVPPALQREHMAILGATGSGKTTTGEMGILANHVATDGADIVIAPKGDGFTRQLLMLYYARHGNLDNVLYFDCAEVVPATGFFDIRSDLEAGVTRETAINDRINHYTEIIEHLRSNDDTETAKWAKTIIEALIKTGFDPVHGAEAFSHKEIQALLRNLELDAPHPPVSTAWATDAYADIYTLKPEIFQGVKDGTKTQMRQPISDSRVAQIFDHVSTPDGPHLDLDALLNEDVLVILDMGRLNDKPSRILTTVLLSMVWAALQRRVERSRYHEKTHPLVNIYIEEASNLADSDLLDQLLSKGRSFDCSVLLSLQFASQIKGTSHSTYNELLNNIKTFVVGPTDHDKDIASIFQSDEMEKEHVGNRLRNLHNGGWMLKLPAAFGESRPRPFLIESLSLPVGHPEGDAPVTPAMRDHFEQAFAALEERTRRTAGVEIADAERATAPTASQDTEVTQTQAAESAHDAQKAQATPAADSTAPDATDGATERSRRAVPLGSLLPYTKRLPTCVTYDRDAHAVVCTGCSNRYDPTDDGLSRAIDCCHALEEVDPDDIPITTVHLKRSREELDASAWSLQQLLFLQVVYSASQLRYEAPGYDLLTDSMLRLQEYVGIEHDEIEALLDADLLRQDTDHPHRLYTVTADGRHEIGEGHRQGLDYGDGKGDLGESTQHILGVEVARRWLEQTYVADAESPVSRVETYYELEQDRLDLVGLDDSGAIRVTVEVERVNNDLAEAAPSDYDKMAACDPDEAIWVVMSTRDAYQVVHALNHPTDGEPRITKSYAKTTPPRNYSIDAPGMSAVFPLESLRRQLRGG